jgi:DNA-binding winged helix-turn-helix (wHTH) protein
VQHTVFLFDGFQLDVTRRKLISSGGLVQSLNSRAMEALLLLVANAGELVEKRRLMQTIWPDAVVEDNNLNQCILAIRKALGETAGSNRYIMTVPGRGYRFVSPVRSVTQESGSESVATGPRRWPTTALWSGMVAAACTTLFMLLLLNDTQGTADAVLPATVSTANQRGTAPGIVLRLRKTSSMPGAAGERATTLLAQCLAAKPTMKLRVQLQLVEADGAPAWSDEYLVGAQDLLGAEAGAGSTSQSCRDLVVAAQSAQEKISGH